MNTNFRKMSKKNLAILIILVALTVDQIIKIYVKTHFVLGEEVEVFSWFKIHFVENNGMAMGFEFGGKIGKLFLTLFRLVAITGIIYWLWQTIKKKVHNAVIIAIAFIFSGAVGNIIDSVFYGVLFDSSQHKVATLFAEKPYGELFYGKVVDMFYFPFIENAIEHAFPNKKENKEISIDLTFVDNKLVCKVLDNGVGINIENKTANRNKSSLATKITAERLQMLSKEFSTEGSVTIQNRKEFGKQGTLVTLVIPYKN